VCNVLITMMSRILYSQRKNVMSKETQLAGRSLITFNCLNKERELSAVLRIRIHIICRIWIRNIPHGNKSGPDLLTFYIWIYLMNFLKLHTKKTSDGMKTRHQQAQHHIHCSTGQVKPSLLTLNSRIRSPNHDKTEKWDTDPPKNGQIRDNNCQLYHTL
jgi:hypothetical protein